MAARESLACPKDMLENLLSIVKLRRDDEPEAFVSLHSVVWLESDIELGLDVNPGDGPMKRWRVRCNGVHANRFVEPTACSLEVTATHPVLWPQLERQVQLFFNGQVRNSALVVADLARVHLDLVGLWFPFGQFLNAGGSVSLDNLLMSGYGLLAEGPETLINAYRGVLEKHQLRPSSPPSQPARYWSGTTWVESPRDLKAMILDRSFVVASSFEGHEVG